MRITAVTTYILRSPKHDRFGAQEEAPALLAGGRYYFEKTWTEVYANVCQTVLVRVDTDEGLHGWGEAQAPIAPEVAESLVHHLLAPIVLGEDPRQHTWLFDRMYESMTGRGQLSGFMLDAIAGVDTALWDVHGRAAGESVAQLLGGRPGARLPAYVSGLRAPTLESRTELVRSCLEDGFAGVKIFLGRGRHEDISEFEAIREGVGDDATLLIDLLWAYGLRDAIAVGRAAEAAGVKWIEAPMRVEDVRGHARLTHALDIAIASGETLRTEHEFLPWFQADALDVAQPDIARCGITAGRRIADLARVHRKDVGFHLGLSFGASLAATWQIAAATPNVVIQEHEPPMFELTNSFLQEPLRVERGQLVVPDGPGLGIEVDLEALQPMVVTERTVTT